MEDHFLNQTASQEAFDQLASRFYQRNFGQMSKSDIEVLMFSIYIEQLWKNRESDNDFEIAKRLGITEAKVRSLKVKKELQYPRQDLEWEKAFFNCITEAKYDDKKNLVKVSILDPNVKRCVENRIDQLHFYSEYQLNNKLLQMRGDMFIELCQSVAHSVDSGLLFDSSDLEEKLRASASGKLIDDNLWSRIKENGIQSCMEEIIKAGGRIAFKTILNAIPFGSTFQPMITAFIENL